MQTQEALKGFAGPLFAGLLAVSTGAALAESDAAKITIEPIGHWHVFAQKSLSFKVADAEGRGVARAAPVVEITRTGSDRVTVRTVKEGQIEDNGDGTYTLAYTPSSIGGYAMIVKAAIGDNLVVSAPIPFEVARDGDEGIKVLAQGTEYVYQIRYNWDPGHIHAHESKPVSLVFELMRGTQTGSEINWEKPWTNVFDHVTGAEDMTVRLTAEDGSVSEEMPGEYKGKGVYEAARVFKPGEVGHERQYVIMVSFLDPVNGAHVENPGSYALRAVAAH